MDQQEADEFLYLGFTRAEAEGTTFLAFELNQDPQLWDNGRSLIPCRRPGDVQIGYATSGGEVTVEVRQWSTTSTAANGCAAAGSFGDLAGLKSGVDAQGAVNDSAIASHLGGFYSETVPAKQFGEAVPSTSCGPR